MLYDDGNHGPRIPYAPPQIPYASPPRPINQSFAQGPMRQGSYADYYNGLTGGPARRQKQFRRDVMGLPYNLQRAILLRNGQRMPQGNMAYASPPPTLPSFAPRPRYMSGAGMQSQPGGMFGYYPRMRPGSQFDINGRPVGAWDYTEPQPQTQYPMVTY